LAPGRQPEHAREASFDLPGLDVNFGQSELALAGNEAAALEAVRRQIAFYGSTPAYQPVLAHHGLEKLHVQLHALSRQGDWDAMASKIDDATLELFAVLARPGEVRSAIETRYGRIAQRVTLSTPYQITLATLRDVAAAAQ
jgi:hypothetical protein